ncbi:hypothetical protein GOAMI_21_01210 [Gordonia amicalis NBRC 100051 = JCM 11271]|nr:hypothetical protein GOAMI_21_01210 [Gordonia amicalis NBRC 100051 = JCM 11271]
MGDHQNSGAASSGGRQEVPDRGREFGVQCGGRLVGDEDLWVAGEGCGDRCALGHPAGQFVRVEPQSVWIEVDRQAQLDGVARAVEPDDHLVEL